MWTRLPTTWTQACPCCSAALLSKQRGPAATWTTSRRPYGRRPLVCAMVGRRCADTAHGSLWERLGSSSSPHPARRASATCRRRGRPAITSARRAPAGRASRARSRGPRAVHAGANAPLAASPLCKTRRTRTAGVSRVRERERRARRIACAPHTLRARARTAPAVLCAESRRYCHGARAAGACRWRAAGRPCTHLACARTRRLPSGPARPPRTSPPGSPPPSEGRARAHLDAPRAGRPRRAPPRTGAGAHTPHARARRRAGEGRPLALRGARPGTRTVDGVACQCDVGPSDARLPTTVAAEREPSHAKAAAKVPQLSCSWSLSAATGLCRADIKIFAGSTY